LAGAYPAAGGDLARDGVGSGGGVWGNQSAERYCGGICGLCGRECGDGEEDVLGVETEGGIGDIGVFADTITEGIGGSCEWVELELAMLWASEASIALAASMSVSCGFSFSFPLAKSALPWGAVVLQAFPLPFTLPNSPPPEVTPLNFHRTPNSPWTSGTLLS
jgi:hypothetical protein